MIEIYSIILVFTSVFHSYITILKIFQIELNKTFDNNTKSELNATFEVSKPVILPVQKAKRSDSYEVTPERKPIKTNKNENNYDIHDLKSDCSTDDDEDPKKKIPPWAQGMFRYFCLFQILPLVLIGWFKGNLEVFFQTLIFL